MATQPNLYAPAQPSANGQPYGQNAGGFSYIDSGVRGGGINPNINAEIMSQPLRPQAWQGPQQGLQQLPGLNAMMNPRQMQGLTRDYNNDFMQTALNTRSDMMRQATAANTNQAMNQAQAGAGVSNGYNNLLTQQAINDLQNKQQWQQALWNYGNAQQGNVMNMFSGILGDVMGSMM